MSETNSNQIPAQAKAYVDGDRQTNNPSNQRDLSQSNNFSTDEAVVDSELSSSASVQKNAPACPSNPQKKIDWHKNAHKLREHNRQLLKQVFKLEQAIADRENQLQEQLKRSQSTDLLIAQQAEEISHSQEEIARLLQELETSQQEKHSQQVLLDNFSKQIEDSQGQLAQLERECALLQEKYNKQTHELMLKEQQNRELHARLHRQQRYTLQYKAALDQYLNVSLSDTHSETKLNNQPFQFETRPIKAWSLASLKSQNSTDNQASVNLESEKCSTPSPVANWPSPVISAPALEKKPKSLATVELPRLPRQGASS